ncbi:MAG: AsmA family protein [Rikenellaceae bacterium]
MRAKRSFGIFGIVVVTLILLTSVVVGLIATPEVLTPRVEAIARQYIKSDFSIKSVDISLFNRFPNITLRIDSLRIAQTKDSIGDLLFARECRVAVNPFALLNKKLVVNHLSLRGANTYIYVDSLHGPLKHFNFEESSEPDTIKDSSFDISQYSAFLRRIHIDSMQITIDDRTKKFYTRVDDFGVDMSMRLSAQRSRLDVVTGFSNLIVWNDGELLVKKTSMELDSRLFLNMDSLKMNFEKANIKLNGIDFKSSGTIRRDTISDGMLVDINSSLKSPSLAEFLELIPSSVIDDKDKITTKGEVALDVEVKGVYSDSLMPTIAATLKIDKARAKYASRKLSLERVSCDAYTFIDINTPSNTYANIGNLHINTSGIIDLTASGRIDNFLEDPNINMTLKSVIDFDRFTEVFPLNEAVVCSGTNNSDIKTSFRVNDMLNGNYANLFINGESVFHNLELSFDASKFAQDSSNTAYLNLQANEGRMLFGDRVRPDTDSRTLLSTINFSGLNYMAKSGEWLSIKDLELSAGANFDRNTGAVNGVGIRGLAKNSDMGVDSLFNASLESSDITFTISPKNDERDIKIRAEVSSQHISANEPTYNSSMRLSSVDMKIDLLKIDESEWNKNGTVGFSNLEMYTDLFPLEITIPSSDVSVNNRTIYLNNAHMTLGQSEIIATGHINNIIHKLFADPRTSVSGELAIVAPTLHINEIIEATNSSVLMMSEEEDEEEITAQDSSSMNQPTTEIILAIETEENEVSKEEVIEVIEAAEEIIAEEIVDEVNEQIETSPTDTLIAERRANRDRDDIPQDSIGGNRRHPADSLKMRGGGGAPTALFLVPKGVNFVFDLNVTKAIFEATTIDNVEGRATINRGVLSLDKISLNTIGANAQGSMRYRNINRRSANVTINMDIEGVDINRIGELAPSINSMFPMLDSFEGSVDFSLKANANLNADSEIDFATLKSSMEFKGTNLVLMDSETFADLSKTLMFKNKDRNLIDSLEAYALVDGTKVDVLPFLMTIDRYQAIIGGSQVINPDTFDVDYNYNISIMKSPLPFKAGVDITGDLYDFDFKITTAKLKKTNFDEQRVIYEEYRDSIAQ